MHPSKIIHIVRCHAEGEVGDVIVGGVMPPPGDTIWEQARWIARAARNVHLPTPGCKGDREGPDTRSRKSATRQLFPLSPSWVSAPVDLEQQGVETPCHDRHQLRAPVAEGRFDAMKRRLEGPDFCGFQRFWEASWLGNLDSNQD